MREEKKCKYCFKKIEGGYCCRECFKLCEEDPAQDRPYTPFYLTQVRKILGEEK